MILPAGAPPLNQKTNNATRRTRTFVRCVVFVVAVVLLLPSLPWPTVQLAVPAASPFTAIAASLASRALGPAVWISLPVLILAVFRRRWLCRWACPVGLMTECAGRISPVSPTRCKPIPRLGTWGVLLSLAAAAVGYPLFLWLDPLAIFSGTLGLVSGSSTAAVVSGSHPDDHPGRVVCLAGRLVPESLPFGRNPRAACNSASLDRSPKDRQQCGNLKRRTNRRTDESPHDAQYCRRSHLPCGRCAPWTDGEVSGGW